MKFFYGLIIIGMVLSSAHCEWIFTPFECSQNGCLTGQGVIHNTQTGESWALYPTKDTRTGEIKPIYIKINFMLDEKGGK